MGMTTCPDSSKEATQSMGAREEPSLARAFAGFFDIGFGCRDVGEKRAALVAHHASTLTCARYLKPKSLRPGPEEWSFEEADAWLGKVESLGLKPVGHVLVWCYQMPEWLMSTIEADELKKEEALVWQDDHIAGVLTRYGKRIKEWDVVNEALGDGGPDAPLLRGDAWSNLCGADYIVRAFRAARKHAPDATLIYNDYLLYEPAKRQRLFTLLKILEKEGCAPDMIGIQGHCTLTSPDLDDLERAIVEIHAAGYPVAITELDLGVYQRSGGADVSLREVAENQPRIEVMTPELHARQAARYRDLFALFMKHSDKIERVTFWNTDDGNSWLNDWPLKGRRDHPLLFDRELKPKPAFEAVMEVLQP